MAARCRSSRSAILLANRIPEKFPGLRFGFIEASAGWAPFMMHILRRLFKDRPKFKNSAELFRDYNLFIACRSRRRYSLSRQMHRRG